jgi:hypothetical protein
MLRCSCLQRLGSTVPEALRTPWKSTLAVILQHEATTALSPHPTPTGGLLTPLSNAERARISGPVADAFGHTFFWALVMALVTIVPAAVLIHAEHTRRGQQATISLETAESEPTVPRARAA